MPQHDSLITGGSFCGIFMYYKMYMYCLHLPLFVELSSLSTTWTWSETNQHFLRWQSGQCRWSKHNTTLAIGITWSVSNPYIIYDFIATMSYLQMRTKTATRTADELLLLWTACVELAYSRTRSVQGSVCRCFQDLEKLRKAQTTSWTFWKPAS